MRALLQSFFIAPFSVTPPVCVDLIRFTWTFIDLFQWFPLPPLSPLFCRQNNSAEARHQFMFGQRSLGPYPPRTEAFFPFRPL